jgi:hypothetical protein
LRSASKRLLLGTLICSAAIVMTAAVVVRPSNNRHWIAGQEKLPTATIDDSVATIRNVRNFDWAAGDGGRARWEDRSYALDRIETAWFILAPFSKENRGPAHTFLSFGFADSQYIAISIEARRELGEDYSLLKGVLRRFEVIYVIGDERDLIGLRTNVRGDDVYVYPIRASREKIRSLFVQMLERANRLSEQPEFYNTVTNNCTTNILKHANRITPQRIPYGKEVLLPGYADELAQRLGLIDTSLPIEEARKLYLVNERARAFATDPHFSRRIRNLN